MPTPTQMLTQFQVNTGSAATGSQTEPKIIGLANGNILVVWTESADGSIGTDPGTDIIGKIYDSEGNVVVDSFRLGNWFSDDERDFDIAATNDGGFVMALVDDAIGNADQTTIRWSRFDESGTNIDVATVADESIAADSLSNPTITVNQLTNESIITFTDNVGGDQNIRFATVSDTGVVGTEFDAAQNSTDFDRAADHALLSNGNFAVVYEEGDSPDTSIEVGIRSTSGTLIFGFPNVANGSAPKVAALAEGGFVMVWEDGSQNVNFRIYTNGGSIVNSGTVVGTADSENEPNVIGLPDGGFVVTWDNDTDLTLEAQRFNADGTTDGSTFVVGTNDPFTPDISVTSDGRILFTWESNGGLGEIFASVWDPRGNTINAADYDQGLTNFVDTEVITGGVAGSTINGDFDDNTLIGLNGNDTISGGGGVNTVYGGGGSDTIYSSGEGSYFGEGGNDYIVAADTSFGSFEILDGGSGNDTLDLTVGNYDYTLDMGTGVTNFTADFGESYVDFENVISGSGADNITGTGGANFIDTGAGNDVINAAFGDDTLVGGDGDDTLNGQGGRDTASYYNATSAVTVSLLSLGVAQNTFGAGVDTLTSIENLTGSAFNDALTGSGTSNIIEGGEGDDFISGLSGADRLFGGDGDDELIGGFGFDRLEGGAGIDSLTGNFGDDVMLGGSGNDLIDGNSGSDTIYGGTDNDTIFGGFGLDNIYGGTGDDLINGGVGIDDIFGEEGNDIIDGGAGDDTIDGGDGSDEIVGGNGEDTIFGGLGVDTISGAGGNDLLYGGDQGDILSGGGGADELHGGTGSDSLSGDSGADDLFGEGGNDTLAGGFGVDTLTGGTGGDTFVFASLGHSSSSAGAADTITDFSKAQGDIIDLSAIDANANVGGNQGFAFVGQSAFSGTAGELRYEYDGGGDTLLLLDVDGDGSSDMTVRLTGEIALTGAQFGGLAAADLPDVKSAGDMTPALVSGFEAEAIGGADFLY
ncbi:calcium-binding protein [Qipengyuania sp. XHP0211]|uniref:calcium-binding protein n=1 Tax=Qipengyuania sp. XHP0211 TaxID=3038079 RepID=UPI00241DB56C|nr:calcium-binding protein [Qipengyuania sp. XHP0211]MDG5750921.1 calcium-binding protein [Qipengyuania sp. XHP0211]